MRKTMLVLLVILFVTPMLSGCFYYPYPYDWYDRGYRHHRGSYEGRDYDRHRDGAGDGYRDHGDRR